MVPLMKIAQNYLPNTIIIGRILPKLDEILVKYALSESGILPEKLGYNARK